MVVIEASITKEINFFLIKAIRAQKATEETYYYGASLTSLKLKVV